MLLAEQNVLATLEEAKNFLVAQGIEITGSFSFANMAAVFIRDPDRNVIELDAYGDAQEDNREGYSGHPG